MANAVSDEENHWQQVWSDILATARVFVLYCTLLLTGQFRCKSSLFNIIIIIIIIINNNSNYVSYLLSCRWLQSDVSGVVGAVVCAECLRSGGWRMRTDMRSVLLLSTPRSTQSAQTIVVPTARLLWRRHWWRRALHGVRLLSLHFPLVCL